MNENRDEIQKPQTNISGFIETIDDLQLWNMSTADIKEFDAFIKEIYYTRNQDYTWKEGEFEQILSEHARYLPHTRLCAVKSLDGTILGTWGLILKDIQSDDIQLPIEEKFGIHLNDVNHALNLNARFFFNGFRTAINKDALEKLGFDRNKSILLFDLLLRGLTQNFDEANHMYIGVSEMEKVVLRYHKRIGIPWIILGEPKTYWGTTNYPCAFSLGAYHDHMKKNHPDRFRLINRIEATQSL